MNKITEIKKYRFLVLTSKQRRYTSGENHQKSVFVNSVLKTHANCQKYTPPDCFFGDFAHWNTIRRFKKSA